MKTKKIIIFIIILLSFILFLALGVACCIAPKFLPSTADMPEEAGTWITVVDSIKHYLPIGGGVCIAFSVLDLAAGILIWFVGRNNKEKNKASAK